jgi:hypothetical protein
MTRFLAPFSVALLAAFVPAQCLTVTGTSHVPNMGQAYTQFPAINEGLSNPAVPLGFTFPIPGTAGFTHICVMSNGAVYFTTGGLPTNWYVLGNGSLASLRGTSTTASPRLFVWPNNLDDVGPNAGDIKIDQTATTCKVTWENLGFWYTNEEFTFSLLIDIGGGIEFTYGSTGWPSATQQQVIVGVSRGGLVGTGAEPSLNLRQPQNTGAVPLMYQQFPAGSAFPSAGKTIRFQPNGSGGYSSSVTCQQAQHLSYGSGCYSIINPNESFHEDFLNTAASSVLNGQSMTMTPLPGFTGYVVTWGGGTYVAPGGGATSLTLGDEDEQGITPSTPFPNVDGSAASLAISSNGVVTFGGAPSGNETRAIWTQLGQSLRLHDNPVAAVYSWRDYDPTAAGAVKFEEAFAGPYTVLYVSYEGVAFWNTTLPETVQFQLTLAGPNAGQIKVVWQSMLGAGLNSILTVGYSPGGLSVVSPAMTLSTGLPIVTSEDNELLPPALSASPKPTFTLGGSSVPMVWQVDNARDASPGAPGVYVGMLIFSLSPPIGGTGIDLTLIGVDAPGCSLLVGSLDVTFGVVGFSSTLTQPIQVPQPLSAGNVFYSQFANFITPGSLPNGQNNFGLVMSNGLSSEFQLR